MPTYSYTCQEHGVFDAIKKISERQEAKCPECDKQCKQAITAPRSIHGGFYDTVSKVR
ncbi:FmdB-like transcriptional regulator [Serratia phage 92A1]|nr:FmdB-like transcriptional regulator [Serratia phage 92A1]